jgi:hypothetical protein
MIPRLQALGPRQDPNLQEMRPPAPVLILLGMRHPLPPGPCRREVHITPLEVLEQLLALALPFIADGVVVRWVGNPVRGATQPSLRT